VPRKLIIVLLAQWTAVHTHISYLTYMLGLCTPSATSLYENRSKLEVVYLEVQKGGQMFCSGSSPVGSRDKALIQGKAPVGLSSLGDEVPRSFILMFWKNKIRVDSNGDCTMPPKYATV